MILASLRTLLHPSLPFQKPPFVEQLAEPDIDARAAKAHFSSRAFGSSSFHLLFSVFKESLSLIRVTLLFAVIVGLVRLGRCMHVSDWTWSARLVSRFKLRSELFSVFQRPRPVSDDPVYDR